MGCSKNNSSNSSTKDSVLYSAWQPFNMSFSGFDSNNDSIFAQTITAAAVTQNIIDKGTVMVYFSDGTGDYADAANAGFSVILHVGSIDLSTIGSVPSTWQWRYVIIPGTIATTSQVKGLSYAEASNRFNVK